MDERNVMKSLVLGDLQQGHGTKDRGRMWRMPLVGCRVSGGFCL